MSNRFFPVQNMPFYQKKDNKKSAQPRDLLDSNSPFDDSNNIVTDDYVIPRTPSPPSSSKIQRRSNDAEHNKRKRSNSEQDPCSSTSFMQRGGFNKLLNKVKEDDQKVHSVSMITSPSIMFNKPTASTTTKMCSYASSPCTITSTLAEKQSIYANTEDIFDDLKELENKDSDCNSRVSVVSKALEKLKSEDEPSKHLENPHESVEKETSLDLPPVIPFKKPSFDFDTVNLELIKNLKENSNNLRLILEHIKKANDKLLKFRRDLAEHSNDI